MYLNSLYGMPVYEIPEKIVPVLQIDPNLKWISDKCRAEVNASLLSKFGTRDESAVPRGQVLMFGNNIFARTNDFAMIRNMVV